MELISKEEVKAIIECTTGYHKAIKDAFDRVMELPTIESRAKGKWIRKEYYFDEWVDECSVCGEAYVMIDGTAMENGYNYCPHCGAYMRGEE